MSFPVRTEEAATTRVLPVLERKRQPVDFHYYNIHLSEEIQQGTCISKKIGRELLSKLEAAVSQKGVEAIFIQLIRLSKSTTDKLSVTPHNPSPPQVPFNK